MEDEQVSNSALIISFI